MKDAEVMEDTENCEPLLRENQHTTVMKYMEAAGKLPLLCIWSCIFLKYGYNRIMIY